MIVQPIFTRISRILQRTVVRHLRVDNMSTQNVHVRRIADEDRIQISFDLPLPSGKVRTFNFDREKSEPLQRTIERMTFNILKAFTKKKKKAQSDPEPELTLNVIDNSADICSLDVPNDVAWVKGSKLKIGDDIYDLIINAPTIKSVKLPESIMENFAIYPKIGAEFTDFAISNFIWYKISESDAASKESRHVQTQIGEGIVYRPKVDDLGNHLAFKCVPISTDGSVGESFQCVSKAVVNAGPGHCLFDSRQMFTQNKSETNELRLVSYNILADVYADSDYTRSVLFPYCAHYALEIDYRKQLIIKEIVGYNADIICLQEVGRRLFMSDLTTAMEVEGFAGLLQLKAGQSNEGCALFYRSSKLRFISDHSIAINEHLRTEPYLQTLFEQVEKIDSLKELVMNRATIVQVAILECADNPKQRICAANTHLYFHPQANHVRLIQIVTAMKHIQHIVDQQKSEGFDVALVFCGDFNSNMKSGVNKFMTKSEPTAQLRDWKYDTEQSIEGLDFQHGFCLESGCGTAPYTNYTAGFHGVLDHVYVDRDRFDITEVVPNPDHEEVIQHTGLPSVVAPSDHIAQCCVVRWK